MRIVRIVCLSALILAGLMPAHTHAQPVGISAGPQLSLMGIGLSGSVQVTPLVSGSIEFNMLPFPGITLDEGDLSYTTDAKIRGGLLAVNLHPLRSRFALSAGLLFGGYGFTATATPTGSVEVGGTSYPASQVGSIDGDFSLGGPSPVVLIGWRGTGFNFSLGVAGARSKVELTANGMLGSDPTFQKDLDAEMEDVREGIELVPVIPYLRIGYQFGF